MSALFVIDTLYARAGAITGITVATRLRFGPISVAALPSVTCVYSAFVVISTVGVIKALDTYITVCVTIAVVGTVAVGEALHAAVGVEVTDPIKAVGISGALNTGRRVISFKTRWRPNGAPKVD